MRYTAQQKAAEQQQLTTRPQANVASTAPSHIKTPTQVYLYGFSPSTSWAAIEYYERVSGGIICEDYERNPPTELRRFPNNISQVKSVHPRPLTKPELVLARKFDGGNCWLKVTFDSAEAADRAVYNSPHVLQGHLVYAKPWHGVGPDADEPIVASVGDRERLTGFSAQPPAQTLGASFRPQQSRATATLPRSFTAQTTTQDETQQPSDISPQSSTTATSGTVTSGTATGINYPNLTQRATTQTEENRSSSGPVTAGSATASRDPNLMRFFDQPRTQLRPASEALLPVPSTWERMMMRLEALGLIPGEIIGNGPPRLDNGDFDWAAASFYWRFFYWLDTKLGTDICGMRPDGDDE